MGVEVNLIFLSLENWDEIWRRNQFVCAEYARRHPAAKILFVTPPRDLTNAIRRRDWSRLRGEQIWSPEGLPNIHVLKPTKFAPNTLELGRSLNSIALRRQVQRAARELGVTKPLLWINDHSAADLLGTLGESSCIYDITDDWISFDQPAFLRERIRRQDAELCRTADATIVCSQRLLEMKREFTSNLHLIPNGVDAAHYAQVLDGALPFPAEAARWPKPALGYTGTLHPDRIDVQLVESLARAHKGSVVLIGPDHLPVQVVERLKALKNLFMPGPVPYAQIPQYMAAFDACIVPHKMTPFTESLNPIKLWEYLAAGLPIVSTDVAGFRDYPELVLLARTADEFIVAASEALSEGLTKTPLRRAEALKNSWERRVDEIEMVMNACVRSHRGHRVAEVTDVA
jgi:glycosyltransferase involved in cell wall biosynthesis